MERHESDIPVAALRWLADFAGHMHDKTLRLKEPTLRRALELAETHDDEVVPIGVVCFMPDGKPSPADAERARQIARERGWLTDDGWAWDS